MAPLTVIDNIGSSAFPGTTNSRAVTSANWLVQSFRTPIGSLDYFLKSLRLALSGVTLVPQNRSLTIGLYSASDAASTVSGSVPVSGGGFRPIDSPLVSSTVSLSLSTNGNAVDPTTNGFTVLDSLSELGSLFGYRLQPNTAYSLVFSSADGIRFRSTGSSYVASSGFSFLNNTGTGAGSTLSPIAITAGSWQISSRADLSTFGSTIGVEVPGPLPVLGGAAAFGFSRRLRRRIQQQP